MAPKRTHEQRRQIRRGLYEGLSPTGMLREAADLIVADDDDLKRLVILAAQKNPHLLRTLKLGFLNAYARERALEVEAGMDIGGSELFDQAAAEAARLRRLQTLTDRASPDDKRPKYPTVSPDAADAGTDA